MDMEEQEAIDLAIRGTMLRCVVTRIRRWLCRRRHQRTASASSRQRDSESAGLQDWLRPASKPIPNSLLL